MSAAAAGDRDRRLTVARTAVESVGAALLALRGTAVTGAMGADGQLKTAVDQAAEGWVLGYLRATFPGERILAEEQQATATTTWAPARTYWTVDALDGTRSFAEGFEGFCVQVAFIQDGAVQVGVVHAPALQRTYWAVAGAGAFVAEVSRTARRLQLSSVTASARPVVIDSVPPTGAVELLMRAWGGTWTACGSFGVKLCRIADGTAHLLAKAVPCAVWDVAPAALIIQEAGGRVGSWRGEPLVWDTVQTHWPNLLAAPADMFAQAVEHLAGAAMAGRV